MTGSCAPKPGRGRHEHGQREHDDAGRDPPPRVHEQENGRGHVRACRLPLTRQVLADQLETATPAQMESVDRWMNAEIESRVYFVKSVFRV